MGAACTTPSARRSNRPQQSNQAVAPNSAAPITTDTTNLHPGSAAPPSTSPSSPAVDYHEVYSQIASLITDPTHQQQDGYGPGFVRLAWHSCATYSKPENSGGSDGAYMRLEFPSNDPLHGGLDLVRTRLEPVKAAFPAVTYADLYVLCGVVGVKELGGPSIPWRPGRRDIQMGDKAWKDQQNRFPLPEDSSETMHAKFARMGLTKQDMVALLGGHCLGRGHMDRSGYDGPWIDDPTEFSNEYFVELLEDDWKEATLPTGKQQFEAYPEGEKLMMLPTDMHLLKDPETKELCEIYAKNQERFFKDFSAAFVKLMEAGVEFPKGAPVYTF